MNNFQISWDKLRPWDGSANRAFELLCSQLAYHEKIKNKDFFNSTGLRDAGVECYWTLKDGSEIGWQAKFLKQSIQEKELGQIDKSVKTAISKHPKLKKYIVCLPRDLDDPRIPNQSSEKKRWENHVKKWEAWAHAKGLNVDFEFWGEHHLIERLTQEKHAGRRYFWFNESEFSDDWFKRHLDSQINKASHRYSPKLHVDLPLVEDLTAFLRKKNFYNEFKNHRIELKSNGKYIFQSLSKIAIDQAIVQSAEEKFNYILSVFELYKSFSIENFDFKRLSKIIRDLGDDLDNILASVKSIGKQKSDSIFREISTLSDSLREAFYFVAGESIDLANSKCLAIKGPGGSGKTHLLCDLCNERKAQGLPTLLFFGDDFINGDPWTQIINRLQVNCKREELLESLNTIAFLSNSYGIIAIDALNEGEGKRIWKSELLSILSTLQNYPYLKLIISIRSDYLSAIIDYDAIKSNTAFIEHKGFQKVEFTATKKFFDFYKIERPKIPLLVPEFSNPLFLKLFCEAIEKGQLKVEDINKSGVSSVYSAFLEGVNSKLSRYDQLDYDKHENKVGKAVYELSKFKFSNQKQVLLRSEAKEILNQIHQSSSYENSLLKRLLSEGVLKETVLYNHSSQEWDEAVDFAYERLSDYLKGEFLVNEYIRKDTTEIDTTFYQWLYERTELDIWHSGVLEALSILCPEKLGFELIEQFPKKEAFNIISPFIKSLIWRNPRYINDNTIGSINKHVLRNSSKYTLYELFDAFLLLSSNPSHRLNSKGLHNYLKSHDLAKREAIWQDYLRTNYYEEGVINRVLDWSLSKHNKSNISNESLLLYGIVLCWFFTSTNRELRDKATKGFTNIFLKRPHLIQKILKAFSNCDDPYLTERLYAAILGICQLNNQKNEVLEISNFIYADFFKNGTPTSNILIRDYARGIVEASERFTTLPKSKKIKISPPYNSSWPQYIPSTKELEKSNPFDISKDQYTNQERALGRIFHSVLHDDFSRYIIGTNWGTFDWKPIRLNDKEKSEKDLVLEFLITLTERQFGMFSDLLDLTEKTNGIYWSNENNNYDFNGKSYSGKQLVRKRKSCENRFLRSLGKKKTGLYEELTKKYITNIGHSDTGFNLELAQRWILNRVFDLGWDEKLHGDFDTSFSSFRRNEHRQERIGKKYQWIAYFEFLGMVSDNFVLDSIYSDSKDYLGTWQISVRNIDPSMIHLTNKSDKYFSDLNWWNNVEYDEWLDPSDWKTWIKKASDIPDPTKLMTAKNPIDGTDWYTFHNGGHWRNVLKEEKYDSEYQELWYTITPFVIARKDLISVEKALFDSKGKLDLPNIFDLESIYYGEQYYSSAFKDRYRKYRPSDWIKTIEKFDTVNLPAPIMLPFYSYFKSTSQDYSLLDGIKIYIPVETIANDLQLSLNEKIGYFFNQSGQLIAYNPHLYKSGESVCLFNKEALNKYLKDKDWTILWKIHGEKIEQQSVRKNKYFGRLIIRGHYYLDQNFEIQGSLYPNFETG